MAELLADLLRGGTQIPVGELFRGLYDGEQRAALLPVDVGQMGAMFESAAAWYGDEPFRVVQLVWPDRSGWLPWESGFDPALAGVPCIAVSANAMPADIADALRAGFDAYITKPIASARLFAEVDRVLAAQQA